MISVQRKVFLKGFPHDSAVNPPAQCRRCRFDPWISKIPWRRKWQPTPVFLSGKSHGQRSLATTVHGFAELDTTGWPSTHPRFYEAEEETGSSGHYPTWPALVFSLIHGEKKKSPLMTSSVNCLQCPALAGPQQSSASHHPGKLAHPVCSRRT